MARTGSDFSGRSGDYAVAISTGAISPGALSPGALSPGALSGGADNPGAGNTGADRRTPAVGTAPVPDSELDRLFTAAIEATEEAILNSLCMAVTTTGYQGHVRDAVPLAAVTGTRGSRYGS
jgi:D-aminopeptidase